MKRYRVVIPVLIVCLTTLFVTPVSAVKPSDVRLFLTENYPYLNGTIVSEKNGRYFATIKTNLGKTTVAILREEVVTRKGSRRLINRTIGVTQITVPDTDNVPLGLSGELNDRVDLGDKLGLPPATLYLRNRSTVDTASILRTIRSVNRIDTVVPSRVPTGASGYRLDVYPRQLRLLRVGSSNKQIASRKLYTEPGQGLRNQKIREIKQFNRVIRDLEWVGDTSNGSTKNLLIASKNRLAIAAADTNISNVTWKQTIYGEILDVSISPVQTGIDQLSLVLVRLRNGEVRSDYYTMRSNDWTLKKHWTRSNIWIHESGGDFFRQRIGINTPFQYGLQRVTVSPEGRNQQVTRKTLSENYFSSPSYLLADTSVFAIDKNGKLALYRNGKQQIRTSEQYGGSPRRVTAQRSESFATINPEFISWVDDSGIRRLLLPYNPASGLTAFQGLTYYESSRLYLLEVSGSTFKRRWESDRLPGYISSMTRGRGAAYFPVVNDGEKTTRIYRVLTNKMN